MKRRISHAARMQRRGVTLLEVVFSIGVVVVGLLGVIALLPLAAKYAEDGVTADRAAYFGRAAVEDFSLRGYARPDMWVEWFPAAETPNNTAGLYPLRQPGEITPNPALRGTNLQTWFRDPSGSLGWTHSPAAGTSFCIDPRFIASAGGQGTLPLGRFFPYSPLANTRMARISLRSAPSVPNIAMNQLQANQVFSSADVLAIDQPRDRTLSPRQLFTFMPGIDPQGGPSGDMAPGRAGVDDDRDGEVDNATEIGWPGSDDIIGKRLAQPRLSWLATLTPRSNSAGELTDEYTLAIVVIKDRPTDFPIEDWTSKRIADEPSTERVFNIQFIGGPEARLSLPFAVDPSVPEAEERAASELDIEPNHWIMLSAFTAGELVRDNTGNVTGRLPGPPEFRWYRVISTDSKVLRADQNGVLETDPAFDESGTWTYSRGVTLEGADWDRPEWFAPGLLLPNGARFFMPTQATVVTGVVAVQEKTIRLETSTLWNLGS